MIIAMSLLLSYHSFLNYSNSPISKVQKKITITIKTGENAQETISTLKNENLIENPYYFKLLLLLKKKNFKAGEYDITTDLTPSQLIDILSSGKPKLYKIIIPEGFTIRQIASRLENLGITKKDEFMALSEHFSDHEFPFAPERLEGYLFPDTYYFPQKSPAKTIIKTMLRKFESVVSKFLEEINQSGYTLHQIITIASIIEKETSNKGEKSLISSVIYNRLRKNMLLQCDPTLIYAMGEEFDGNLRRRDKKIDSPYNTYTHKGLPPGPICNPGENSIKAAVRPANTGYLYFVSKNDGTHYFSKTLKEHNSAVRKYQLRRRRGKSK